MRRIGAFALFLCMCLFTPGAFAAEPVGFDIFLYEILTKNNAVQAAVRNLEATYYGVLGDVAVQRPNLKATLGGNWLSGQSAMGMKIKDITSGSLIFALTQRIDISGIFNLDEKQRILAYESKRAEFAVAVNSIASAGEAAWWGAILARENVILQKDVLRQRSENHRVTLEKFNQQLVPKLDVIRSEAQVVEAESKVKQAETNFLNVLAKLAWYAGGAELMPLEEPLCVPVFDVDISLEKALAARPELRVARLNLERAKIIKKMMGKGNAPTLDFGLNWNAWSDPKDFGTPQDGELAAGLQLNIPILDGNKKKYEVLNADRMVQSAESNIRYIEDTVRCELITAMNSWKQAFALEQDKKRQMERSEEELRITELMYLEGIGAQIDLINAQTANQAVRTDYLNAVKEMYVALVDLRRVVGDYAPDELGNWGEALVLYGKGQTVVNEMYGRSLKDQRCQDAIKNLLQKKQAPAPEQKTKK